MNNTTQKLDHKMASKRFAKAEVWWVQFCFRTKDIGHTDRHMPSKYWVKGQLAVAETDQPNN